MLVRAQKCAREATETTKVVRTSRGAKPSGPRLLGVRFDSRTGVYFRRTLLTPIDRLGERETSGSRKPTNKVSNVLSVDSSAIRPPGWVLRELPGVGRELAPCENARVVDEAKKRPTVGSAAHSPEAPGAAPGAAAATTGRAMTLWTFCQSVLLTFNAFAILNEQRFLEKCGLGQSALTSGYVSATSPRGQLIGLITATQYMRGASSRRSGPSRRRSRVRPSVTGGGPPFLGTPPPSRLPRDERNTSFRFPPVFFPTRVFFFFSRRPRAKVSD